MGGGGGSSFTVDDVKPRKVSTSQSTKELKNAADTLVKDLGKSADELKGTLKKNEQSISPFTQTAQDVMMEMALMTGLPVNTKMNEKVTPESLLGRIQGFDELLNKADPGGTVALSGQQITERLRESPGYGAAFNEGEKSMMESDAMKGGIADPNRALEEAKTFGRGMMDLSISNHLDRMTQIAGLTVPVALQQYAQALPNAQAIYNATIAGPTAKTKILNHATDLELQARQFNISQKLQADMANSMTKQNMLKATMEANRGQGAGSGAMGSSSAPPSMVYLGGGQSQQSSNGFRQQLANPAAAQFPQTFGGVNDVNMAYYMNTGNTPYGGWKPNTGQFSGYSNSAKQYLKGAF